MGAVGACVPCANISSVKFICKRQVQRSIDGCLLPFTLYCKPFTCTLHYCLPEANLTGDDWFNILEQFCLRFLSGLFCKFIFQAIPYYHNEKYRNKYIAYVTKWQFIVFAGKNVLISDTAYAVTVRHD